MKRFALCLALAGCTSSSQIGPYVKSVARNGAWLAVHKCMIELHGETLSEGACTVEHVPLGTVPSVPQYAPPQPAPPPPRVPVSTR